MLFHFILILRECMDYLTDVIVILKHRFVNNPTHTMHILELEKYVHVYIYLI